MIGLVLSILLTLTELNCENLFDCRHDSLKNDYEFLPEAEWHWTPNRYWNKVNNLAKEIVSCGTLNHLPDIVCLTEVENDSVMIALTRRSLLRNAGYEYVMTNSDDERGIDVAMLYQPSSLRVMTQSSLKVPPKEGERPTRDILYIKGEYRNGDTLNIFVVHFPSRRGGESATRDYRLRAAQTILDKLSECDSWNANHSTIITGDFNDYKDDKSLQLFYNAGLINATRNATGTNGARGTYKYRGEWNSLDHVLIAGKIKDELREAKINDSPFLLQGEGDAIMPKRTYRGTFYQGGYSDHLPLIVNFELK